MPEPSANLRRDVAMEGVRPDSELQKRMTTMTKKPKALYSACSEAVRGLIEHPPQVHEGTFTELDVVTLASSPDWTPEDWKQAMRQASQVCGLMFRTRRLSRYGPVRLADGTEDYVRIATKIAYADPLEGPANLETPNGSFPRMMIEDDGLGHQGRRRGTNRNDLEPWESQRILVGANHNGVATGNRVQQLEREVRELQAQKDALANRTTWLEMQLRQLGQPV